MERVLALCFPERTYLLFAKHYSSSFGWGRELMGERRRSRSGSATKRAPPIFTDGRTSSAIHRRTVRTEAPVSSAISVARRYCFPILIFGIPRQSGRPEAASQRLGPIPRIHAQLGGRVGVRSQLEA